jgi:hypothetical protein
MFWILVGPSILSLIGLLTALRHQGWLTPSTIVYFAVLAGVVVARWTDPANATGQPSTTRERNSDVALFIPLGVGWWLAANFLGDHWRTS